MTVLANGPTRVLDAKGQKCRLGRFPEAHGDGLAGSLGLDGPSSHTGQVPGIQERSCDQALANYLWLPACLVSATAGHVERILGRDQYIGKCS